jgi:hypothetical protein
MRERVRGSGWGESENGSLPKALVVKSGHEAHDGLHRASVGLQTAPG